MPKRRAARAATRTAVESTTATAGRRSDGRSTNAQTRDSCRSPFSRCEQRAACRAATRASAAAAAAARRREHAGREHGEHAALDPVAELAEQRRAARSASRPCDVKTTSIAPMPSEVKIFDAGEQHAGHRDQHGAARDQHGLARGRGRAAERLVPVRARPRAPRARASGRRASSRRRPPCPISSITELRRVGRVSDVADDGSRSPIEPSTRREREQHRHAGGDERAEREQQDQEGDRHRQRLRLARSPCRSSRSARVRARVAELGDGEARVRLLQPGRPRRAPAARASRRCRGAAASSNWTSAEWRSVEIWPARPCASGERTSRTCGSVAQLRHDAPTVARKPGSPTSRRAALHEHALAGMVVEAGASRGSPRRARSRRCPCSASVRFTMPSAWPSTTATTTNASHPKVGGLPVCGAPSAGALREIRLHRRAPIRSLFMPNGASPPRVPAPMEGPGILALGLTP